MASLAPVLVSTAVPLAISEIDRRRSARADRAALDARQALDRQAAGRQATDAEARRRRALERVLSRQRADLAARGLAPDGPVGTALSLGLIEDSALDARTNSDRLTDRLARLDLERRARTTRSLLDRDRLLLRSFGSGLTTALRPRI